MVFSPAKTWGNFFNFRKKFYLRIVYFFLLNTIIARKVEIFSMQVTYYKQSNPNLVLFSEMGVGEEWWL